MKSYIPYSLLLAAAASGLAYGATAYTTPVGYVTLGNTTPSQPSIGAATDQTISLPVSRPAVFASAVVSSTATTVTFSGTPLASLDLTTTPHIIEITSGSKQGLIGLITAKTSSQVTTSGMNGVDFSTLGSATARIRPAITVGSLMAGASNIPAQTQFLGYTGTAAGIYVPNDIILEWDGANWIDIVNTGEPADSTVLYPGESFIIRNSSPTTPITKLVVSGEVIANKLILSLENLNTTQDQDIPFSYASSVPETVAASGITPFAHAGDQILITDSTLTGIYKSSSVILEFDGADWIDIVNTGEPAQATTYIGGGNGFTYRRKATATVGIWAQNPSYIPSL